MSKLRELASSYTRSARSAATERAYASDWADFLRWCRRVDRRPLPASEQTVALYLVDQIEKHKIATAQRRLAAIADRHRRDKKPLRKDGVILEVMRGARRAKGTAQRQAQAIRPEELRKICQELSREKSATAVRDRALLLIGFAAGMRVSELVALNLDDVSFRPKGMAIRIRRSKTDQEGKGREVGVFAGSRALSCPVRALKAWLYLRGREPGALFPGRDGEGHIRTRSVAEIVKRRVELAGLDPKLYSTHSMRAGFVTAAAENGMPETIIMQRTGHRSIQTVARYVRPASAFAVDALAKAL